MSTVSLQNTLQAQVLYQYVGEDEDQLSIKAGDVVVILDNRADLNGWALARKGDKEGYIPAEYVRYIEPNPHDFDNGIGNTGEYEIFYDKILIQEHRLPFTFKLTKAMLEVFKCFPCSRYGYVTARSELRIGAILSLLMNFVICVFDAFSLVAPILPIGDTHKKRTPEQLSIVCANIFCRILLTLIFIYRFPRQNLIICTFPFLNIISSMTYGIRLYECLELGDNKEYDGYRYYRSWMYCFLINIPFEIAALIFNILGMPGLIAINIMVLVWNIIHVGRCFLAQWANLEKGNDLHPDFQLTIRKYRL